MACLSVNPRCAEPGLPSDLTCFLCFMVYSKSGNMASIAGDDSLGGKDPCLQAGNAPECHIGQGSPGRQGKRAGAQPCQLVEAQHMGKVASLHLQKLAKQTLNIDSLHKHFGAHQLFRLASSHQEVQGYFRQSICASWCAKREDPCP